MSSLNLALWLKHLQYELECFLKREKLVFGQELILFNQLEVKNIVYESQQQVYLRNYNHYHLLCLSV